MKKVDLKNLSPARLADFVAALGWEPYRARQIMSWLYQKRASDLASLTTLSLKAREELEKKACVSSLVPREVLVSPDGTRKYLFVLSDGHAIESVLIPEEGHFTLCLSTQVGCSLKCRFCLTGQRGLVRNLSTAEIVNQVIAAIQEVGGKGLVSNLVFMGMGEPLLNYEHTMAALEIIFHPCGLNFSHRRVTLSSAGVIPGLKRLGKENPVNLAISLNAADNETRDLLMPINKKYPLPELLAACREYPLPHRKRITFEYILIAGVNDSFRDARNLAGLLRPLRCKINLISFNEHPGVDFRRPSDAAVDAFREVLVSQGFTAIVRESRGRDILAACGQLGGKTPAVPEAIEPGQAG